jgi:hypothetical protein
MPRPNHKNIKDCVNSTKHFNAQGAFTEDRNGFYIVFFQGRHYPMWVYDRARNIWYGNKTRHSAQAAKQAVLTRPSAMIEYRDTKELILITKLDIV